MDIPNLIKNNFAYMKEGESEYIHHCKEGKGNDKFNIKRVEDGWLYHCFHCGIGGKVRDGEDRYAYMKSSLSHKPAAKDEDRDSPYSYVKLPADFTDTIPSIALGYLYQYMDVLSIKRLHIGWSDWYKRVVIPIYEDGELVSVQYRKILESDDGPKWKKYVKADWRHFTYMQGNDELVVVEDWISGVVINNLGRSVVVLYGTSLSDKVMRFIISNKEKWNSILIWLDNDNTTVKKKQTQMAASLSLVLPTKVIYAGDPKRNPGVYTCTHC
jgi:hypothetical protein